MIKTVEVRETDDRDACGLERGGDNVTTMKRGMHLLLSLALLATPAAAQRHADLVLLGGKVITVDAENRIVEGVAVVGNRIAAVGEDAELRSFIGPDTEVIDLEGRAVVPGFIDAHSHVEGLAESENARVPIHIPTPWRRPMRSSNG